MHVDASWGSFRAKMSPDAVVHLHRHLAKAAQDYVLPDVAAARSKKKTQGLSQQGLAHRSTCNHMQLYRLDLPPLHAQ